jgi:hypothetical protein
LSVETRKLGPIAQAYFDGFAASNMNWNGEDLPREIGMAFDRAVEYAKEKGEEPTS